MKIIRSILLVIAGALSIFVGVEVDDLPNGDITETNNGSITSQSLINTYQLAEITQQGLCGILYAGGIALIAFAIPTDIKKKAQ